MNPALQVVRQLQAQIEGACAQVNELANRITICSLRWSTQERLVAETTLDFALARLETLEARHEALWDILPADRA